MTEKLSVILLLCLILTFVFLPTAAGAEKIINLEAAVERALEENTDLQIAKLKLENARLSYRKNKAENLITESTYSRLEAEYNLTSAVNTYTNSRNQIISEAINKYTDLLLAAKEIEISETNMELQESLLENVKSQVEVGEKGELDLMEQELEYNNTAYDQTETKRNYEQNRDEIKNLLGLKKETEIVLEELEYPNIKEISEEEGIRRALENNYELILAEKNLKLTARNVQRLQVSTTAELDMKMARNNLKIAELEKDKTEEDIENSLSRTFFDYRQAVRNLELKEENLNTSQENYRLVKQQHEAGLKTGNDLLRSEISLLQAEAEYLSALGSYYLQEHNLEQEINPETGVLIDELEEIQ